MKLGSKIVAGTLIGFGLLGSLRLSEELLSPLTSPEDRREAIPALFLTAAIAASGSWIFWRGQRQDHQQQQRQLQQLFFQTLAANGGRIDPLCFAVVSGLDGKSAQAYLADRAQEFDAVYDITETGTIVYYFELRSAKPFMSDRLNESV